MKTSSAWILPTATWLGWVALALAIGFVFANQAFAKGGSTDPRQLIQDTGKMTAEKAQTLWQRIDEGRLKNRTRDQIVAWVIMGLLAGGLLHGFGKRSLLVSVILGLAGAFIGGIVANVTQLNLGLGPVLVTYEDLLFTLVGAVMIICIVRWATSKRAS